MKKKLIMSLAMSLAIAGIFGSVSFTQGSISAGPTIAAAQQTTGTTHAKSKGHHFHNKKKP